MCERFTLRTPAERVKREFRLEEAPSIEARFNIAPRFLSLKLMTYGWMKMSESRIYARNFYAPIRQRS
jgi:hypothetical protein